MWLERAQKATTLLEKLAYLSQVHYLDPRNPLGQRLTYEMIWYLLERDPYLEYKNENEALYVVSNGKDITLTVPKSRSVPETYPAKPADPLNLAFRWLGWAVIGLAPAGLGTLIFAPLAIFWALQAFLRRSLEPADQVRLALILVIGGILLVMALILNFLLVLHIV
jgi:hypothetical protein